MEHPIAPALEGDVEMGAQPQVAPQSDKLRGDFLGLEG